ncbi:hypothetical protein Desca_1846 [Desulfotomaculum nigrificans CO-1-SRB]|uniref:Uncharacterized protein n=1 Tax=Desulfotomaculum nigrificans (strain DSM 14880 / VKM B-2319 / CO-1-SRB) TaxID=868595 RepID=F6B8C6_DESCC|nr:hypothetical protein [Desulfotomaculum nigrificans]AEF94690.1 hypothetical protein Desca_1846 [Desulfotomaculum nigrificans CO-1-SRB]
MSDQVEVKGGMGMMPGHEHMPMMMVPTLMQRLAQLLHRPISVFLKGEQEAPVTGTLHAVGQDYLELHNGTNNNTQVTIIPLWSVLAVTATGAMGDVCPPPTGYPTAPIMGPGPGMPGCPMPGMPECPMPGMTGGMTGGMPGMPGMPGMSPMSVKDAKKEENK